jgi:DNA modification methylase
LLDSGLQRHLQHCLWLKQPFESGGSDYHYRREPTLSLDGNCLRYFSGDRSQDSAFDLDRPMVSDLRPTGTLIELIASMSANSSKPGELVFDPFSGSGSTI